jgi:hypothetical protein
MSSYHRILDQGVDAAEVTTESRSIYGFHDCLEIRRDR